MLSPQSFRAIVSGRRRGPLAAAARGALRIAEVPYSWAMQRRNLRYDAGHTPSFAASVPVVSVGNLTLGGTGKSPMVEWIARYFIEQGIRTAVVSRGYGAAGGAANDEALELKERLPEAALVQNPDRVAGAATAVEQFGAQVIVLDDGFQHRRLKRDLDIVLLDAMEPFGHEHVFPRGTLREPITGLARADVIVLSRADMIDDVQRQAIRMRVQSIAPTAAFAEAIHAPRQLRGTEGTAALESLAGQRVAAFCGIGNPDAFFHTLSACQMDVDTWRVFSDHHCYTPKKLEYLAKWAEAADVSAVICTHKDMVKIRTARLGSRPLWALEIGLRLTEGEDGVVRSLQILIDRASTAGIGLD